VIREKKYNHTDEPILKYYNTFISKIDVLLESNETLEIYGFMANS